MDTMELTIMSPTVGFDSILFSVCDELSCSSRTLDIEVLAMADLIVEDVEFSNTVKQGEVIEVQVYVRNIGQAEATMISVRCQTDDELVDLDTIPVLQPGQVAIASCQWVVPENKLATQFEVLIDRGLNIQEGNEENNEWTSLLSIEEKEQPSQNEDDSMLSISPSTSLSIATIFIILLIIFFIMFAPAKIKKIE